MNTNRRALCAGLLVLAAVAGCSAAPAPAQTPESVATAFAAAYASGDVPTACELADENVRAEKLDCTGRGYWHVNYWLQKDCPVPGGHSFEYDTDSEIKGHRGFDIVVSDLKVVRLVTHQSSANGGGLCGIYAS